MEKSTRQYFIVDWVEITRPDIQECVGYITNYNEIQNEYCVRIIKNSKGEYNRSTKSIIWADENQIILTEIENTCFDLTDLIDIALDTQDQEWFQELTTRNFYRGIFLVLWRGTSKSVLYIIESG